MRRETSSHHHSRRGEGKLIWKLEENLLVTTLDSPEARISKKSILMGWGENYQYKFTGDAWVAYLVAIINLCEQMNINLFLLCTKIN